MSKTDEFWLYAKEAIFSASCAETEDERRGLIDLAGTWTQAALLERHSQADHDKPIITQTALTPVPGPHDSFELSSNGANELKEPFTAKIQTVRTLHKVSMKLHAPNIALFVISGCLAMLGVLAAMPISLPIPGLTGNPTWYIFLAWFLLSAGTVVPPQWTESEWLGADWFPGIVNDENAGTSFYESPGMNR